MAYRRRRHLDHSARQVPNNVDHLAFKYMEMCKVESSTDSESEISPRWSDTSTMGCVSSAPESGTVRRTLPLMPKAAERHGCYSLFLDPYDGSSEDSDDSSMDVSMPCNRRTRQPAKGGGGCRYMSRSRRFIPHSLVHHPASEVVKVGATEKQNFQMSCDSNSELDALLSSYSDKNDSAMHTPVDTELNDSGLNARSCLTLGSGPSRLVEGGLSHVMDSSSERSASPCYLQSLYKRKLGLPKEEADLGQRKRQCGVKMEDEACHGFYS